MLRMRAVAWCAHIVYSANHDDRTHSRLTDVDTAFILHLMYQMNALKLKQWASTDTMLRLCMSEICPTR